MGFFEEQELENADVDPFSLPVGKVNVFVKEAKVLTLKKDNSQAFVITFAKVGEPDRVHQEWLKNPRPDQDAKVRRIILGRNKRVLLDLGIEDTKEALGAVEPEDLLGITGVLDTYKKGDYVQYGSFTVTDSGEEGDPVIQTEIPEEAPKPDTEDAGFDF